MAKWINSFIAKILRDIANKLDNDTCEITEDEAMDIVHVLAHEALSKEEACIYMNLKTSRFDDLVRDGIIPKGVKRKGWKELRWYKDDLIKVIKERNSL
jgi:hypothetical protein